MVGEHCATQKELVAIFKTIGYQYRPKHGDFYQKSCMMDTDECTLTKDNINFIKDRSMNPFDSFEYVGSTVGTGYRDSQSAPKTTYYYKVRAYY